MSVDYNTTVLTNRLQQVVNEIDAGATNGVLRLLTRRFGAAPEALRVRLEALSSLERLEALIDEAMTCSDLDAFRASLPGE